MLFLAESSAIMYNDYRVVAGAVTRLDVLSVSFSGSSSLERRYEFTKRIDITLRGYAPSLGLAGKRIIVQTVDGNYYLADWEFDAEPDYTFDGVEDTTVYQLTFDENLPVLPCSSIATITTSSGVCAYNGALNASTLILVSTDASCVDEDEIIVYGSGQTVEFTSKSLAFKETYDGTKYSKTIEFELELNDDNVVESYKLHEFLNNRWTALVKESGMIFGHELGMNVKYDITSNDDSASVKVTLEADENVPCLRYDEVSITEDDYIEWRFIQKTPEGLWCWVCDGLEPNPTGNAQYILKCGYYRNGEFADKYLEQREFQGWYPQIQDKVVGTFNDQVYFYKDSCYLDDTLRINSLQSPLYFYIIGKRWSFEVDSQWSNWTATTVPSFVELSQERGTSGRTVVTMTCTGSTSQQGTLMIRNAKYAQSFSVIADYSLPVIVQSNEISYSAQTKSYFCREQVILLERSASNGFTPQVMIAGKKVTIVYPENASENDVTYTFVFRGVKSKKEQTVVITQHPRS